MDNIKKVVTIGLLVANFLFNTDRVHKAIELFNEYLILLCYSAQGREDQLTKRLYCEGYSLFFIAYRRISDYTNAEIYGRKLLVSLQETGDKVEQGKVSMDLAEIYESQNKFTEAKQLYEKAINIMIQTGERKEEGRAYVKLGRLFDKLSIYAKGKEYSDSALAIMIEIGDRAGEAACYDNLGSVFTSLCEYVKAKEYYEKALAIVIEIGNRAGEAACYGNLGSVFTSLSEYVKAKEYQEKALAIMIEIGNRAGEAALYGNLGSTLRSLSEYVKAKEYYEKALAIVTEIGDRAGEARGYGNLGNVFKLLCEYVKAKEYYEKSLAIMIETGNRAGEAMCYASLGGVFISLCENVKAKEYLGKALVIMTEIGDRAGEASCYENVGTVFETLGEYVKAKEYFEKALFIVIEIGNRAAEASCNGKIGTVFEMLGEKVKAKEYHEKALAIMIGNGDRAGQAACYGNLGSVFRTLGEYVKAKEYHEKALAIMIEIGDRAGVAGCYGNLGTLLGSLGEFIKAKECLEKALAFATEIRDRKGEATHCTNLGFFFHSLGEYKVADECFEKALSVSRDIELSQVEMRSLLGCAMSNLNQNKFENAIRYLFEYIDKFEGSRMSFGVNDQFKTSFFEENGAFPYNLLSRLLSHIDKPLNALYVLELGRARGLADLMADQYSVQTDISVYPQSWFGIENIIRKENNYTLLYISYDHDNVNLWILKQGGNNHFKQVSVNQTDFVQAGLDRNLTMNLFLNKTFRSHGFVSEEHCEDRSLSFDDSQCVSPEQESSAALRIVEDDDDDDDFIEEILSLHFCWKIFIAPVDDLLTEPEVIIVPHKSLYKVPFAALCNKEGKYLSATRRIRIVPSLTTLKLIQDSPADYHSQTGALIVGDPGVGEVLYKGEQKNVTPLACARKEAEIVARLVGVTPLLGEEATKQAVLEKITSVSLIHFAAHGNAERGEIALSPVRTPDSEIAPPEEEYLLTMSDISRVKITAKLVVLSCCHSARGQIRAEGVIGIARAFLGSGARSVLVALWAIDDTATEQLMNRFYEHLVSGESASESLHQAMKWMRNNGFTMVSEWAPFMLIGDNVTFEFGK